MAPKAGLPVKGFSSARKKSVLWEGRLPLFPKAQGVSDGSRRPKRKLNELEAYFKQYSDMPREVVLKHDFQS
jgi:hypothetical protein